MRTRRDYPRSVVHGSMSSFRLRRLTAVRTFENQIVGCSGVSDRRAQDKCCFTRGCDH